MCALILFFFLSFHSDSIPVTHSLNPNVSRSDYSLVIQRTTEVLFEPALRNWQHWSGRSCEQNACVSFVANPSNGTDYRGMGRVVHNCVCVFVLLFLEENNCSASYLLMSHSEYLISHRKMSSFARYFVLCVSLLIPCQQFTNTKQNDLTSTPKQTGRDILF